MSSVALEWETRLGRGLRVRDLYILSTVVKSGGMAKAARQLAMTQPAVSIAIANLERMLGVRLLDRSPRGVEPTIFADAMLKRSVAVFDELRQSVKDVESLANPAVGELRIGSPESISATVLPKFIKQFSKKYPKVTIHLFEVPSPAIKHHGLRDRQYDVLFTRLGTLLRGDRIDDLAVEHLFDDPLTIVAGPRSRWAGHSKIELADLIDEPWIFPHRDTWNYAGLEEVFREARLNMPKASLFSQSLHLTVSLVSNGGFLTAYPRSVARFCALKALPVNFSARPWPVGLARLKNRTLSPVAERFLDFARGMSRSFGIDQCSDHEVWGDRKALPARGASQTSRGNRRRPS